MFKAGGGGGVSISTKQQIDDLLMMSNKMMMNFGVMPSSFFMQDLKLFIDVLNASGESDIVTDLKTIDNTGF